MKNKIFIIALFLSSIVLLNACTKELNTKPEAQLTELTTFSDIQNAMRGCYDGFQSANYYNNTSNSGSPSGWSGLPDLMGDDYVEALESLGNWNSMSEMIYAADNTIVQGIFSQPYEIISRVNNLLKFLPAFETGANASQAKQIRAQALAMRAHAHFDLMRYFAVDFGRNSTSLGVPYVTEFDPATALTTFPTRKSVKENYDLILQDLASSLIAFRAGGNTTDNTARALIDSNVVYAIRTRVNYYAGMYSDVIADANVVLNNRPLTNSAGYTAMFTAATEASPVSEVYWAIPSDNALRPGGATSGASASYRITAATSSVIQSMGGAYVNTNVTRFNQTGVGGVPKTLCWKYNGIRSFKVYRAGEMMLMRAEAKQRNGDLTALNDLNTLRTNRGVLIGTETGAALLNAILQMRRVELIGEGHRWFDLRRTTKSIVRAECGSTGSSRAAKCTIAPSERGWIMPIPFNDVKVNTNLSQNPGY
ncbi:MAG: RagB/SusD family nutrient uptake outer membrane protein [Sediminibacterium sp.]